MGGPVQRNIVRKFYACCQDVIEEPVSFTVHYNYTVWTFDLESISQALHVPILHPCDLPDIVEEAPPMLDLISALCDGEIPREVSGCALRSSYMSWDFQILHNLFFKNVYARKSNKVDLTESMVTILYRVSQGERCVSPL